jgi:8-oxo-dGTP pyrophosphatase MutT (NUDIX family)
MLLANDKDVRPGQHQMTESAISKARLGIGNKGNVGARVKDRRCVAANSVFEILFDHIVDASGREIADYLVVQPKHLAPGGISGICVLPIIGDKFVLVDCYRHAIESMSLEAPKGFVEPDETPMQAAGRELAEETGLSCLPDKLVGLGTVTPEGGIVNGRVALFAALGCAGTIRIDTTELGMLSVRLLSVSELAAEIAAERIQDAVTLLLLSRHNALCGRSGA